MNARTEIVPQVGLVHDLPIEQYHGGPALSNSGLRDFARSPFHYHALHINPLRPPSPTRAGQLEGNLAHCMILEPDTFASRYAVGPVDDKRLKAWRDWEDKQPASLTLIKPCQYEVAQAQALAVRSIPDVAAMLARGKAEVSAYWIDEATGVPCRCRPDWTHPCGTEDDPAVVLLDVKTYSDASPPAFAQQIARKGYHHQDAWYSTGYAKAAGVKVLGFVFVAVEDSWPFGACAFTLTEEERAAAAVENAALVQRFAECQRTDTWPPYSTGIEIVQLPRWASAQHHTPEEGIDP
jgi:hypothetical protein